MRVRPLILLATIAIFVGCEKAPEEPKELPEVYTIENFNYLKDPEYRASLDNQVKARGGILRRRDEVVAQMAELDKAGKKSTSEYAELEKKLAALKEEFDRNREESINLVRIRQQKAVADSQLVAEGKAKAK